MLFDLQITKAYVSHHESDCHIQGLTLGRWLHSDLVAVVAAPRSGDGCSPDQVLLPVVEVSDSVEKQLWIGFILAGHLGTAERGKLSVTGRGTTGTSQTQFPEIQGPNTA